MPTFGLASVYFICQLTHPISHIRSAKGQRLVIYKKCTMDVCNTDYSFYGFY